ncbi:unnamed protein product [Schistosoma rodhaini]|uniref:Uncharacterized protein n=1 Tax=Schistosoma rodhaini TaxID=6188 RepID=A0AA85EW01_9TREM|nr:unnamed protein product [Schistosoma rodhaini]
MNNNGGSPHRYSWNPCSPSPNRDPFYRARFNSHSRSPITSTPPFGSGRFPRCPQDPLVCWSPPVGCASYYVDSPPARYGSPNFNQPSYQRTFDSSVNSYASHSPLISNCNPPMNIHSGSISSSSFVSTQDDLSWKYDTSQHNSSSFDISSRSPRNGSRKFNENNRPFKNWLAFSLSDPWEGMKPVRTPHSGYLVDKPPAQRHTVLFAPHERRRRLEVDDDDAVTISPTKQLQRVCSN